MSTESSYFPTFGTETKTEIHSTLLAVNRADHLADVGFPA